MAKDKRLWEQYEKGQANCLITTHTNRTLHLLVHTHNMRAADATCQWGVKSKSIIIIVFYFLFSPQKSDDFRN